jgi:hypothetical protein
LQEVSPEVDEHGNLLPPSDNCDLKRPPTQQKPFMNPKQETTEEVFEKIKSMWHFVKSNTLNLNKIKTALQ